MYKIIIAAVVVLVLIAGGHYCYKQYVASQQVGCTAEALLCPDGSGVGRQGPSCTFSPCPAVESVVGVLERTPTGFRMVLDAPAYPGSEVNYALPIETQAPDTLLPMLNKKVRAYGSFVEGSTLVVSRIEQVTGTDADITRGTLRIGETKNINGVRVTLNTIVSDNRCPVDVQCITAGAVVANITLKSDTDLETRTVASDQKPVGFDAYWVSLENVEPAQTTQHTTKPSEYLLTFRVTPTALE